MFANFFVEKKRSGKKIGGNALIQNQSATKVKILKLLKLS